MPVAGNQERVIAAVLAIFLVPGAWGQPTRPLHSSQACRTFAALAARRPTDPEPHLYLLGCAIRKRDRAAVGRERTAFDRLLPARSRPHAVAGDWLAAAGLCKDAAGEYALAPPPGEAGAVEFALAQCYQNAGDILQALGSYRSALELNSNKEEHHLSLAILLIGTGHTGEAGRVLVNALRLFPRSVRVIVTMSLLHLELGYPDRARMGYEKARALAPASAMVWKLLGRIQNSEGSYEEAVKSFDAAAALEPKDAQIFLFRGLAEVRLEYGADEALKDFLRALELDPALLEARFQAASVYLQAKEDYARAASELEKVVAAAPDLARAHQLLIQAYQRLGLTEKAAAEARKFRQLTQPVR